MMMMAMMVCVMIMVITAAVLNVPRASGAAA
jgi:hypothetical protein